MARHPHFSPAEASSAPQKLILLRKPRFNFVEAALSGSLYQTLAYHAISSTR
ncbi:hypothetical protein [Eikenella corrodens]|uniref:hypothetical protein n=1 Tax=Eikenella corrodens TaxID=539 RepID=UPI0013DF3418|nr:hypothetical protein [Eikenella corrodens]